MPNSQSLQASIACKQSLGFDRCQHHILQLMEPRNQYGLRPLFDGRNPFTQSFNTPSKPWSSHQRHIWEIFGTSDYLYSNNNTSREVISAKKILMFPTCFGGPTLPSKLSSIFVDSWTIILFFTLNTSLLTRFGPSTICKCWRNFIKILYHHIKIFFPIIFISLTCCGCVVPCAYIFDLSEMNKLILKTVPSLDLNWMSNWSS